MDNNKPITPGYEFSMGIVKIGGDAVKVEEKEDGDKSESDE
jgi:hypothetical protein